MVTSRRTGIISICPGGINPSSGICWLETISNWLTLNRLARTSQVSPDWAKYCSGRVSAAILVGVGNGVTEGVGVLNNGVGDASAGSSVLVGEGKGRRRRPNVR